MHAINNVTTKLILFITHPNPALFQLITKKNAAKKIIMKIKNKTLLVSKKMKTSLSALTLPSCDRKFISILKATNTKNQTNKMVFFNFKKTLRLFQPSLRFAIKNIL